MIVLGLSAVVGVALVAGSLYLNSTPSGTASMTGELLISSSGSLSSAGQAVAAAYNVTLAAASGTGTMNLTLLGTTTDIVHQHEFVVTGFAVSPNNLTMVIGGVGINLGWINNNTVWKPFNETYVGAWGPSALPAEVRGSIRPADFGLSADYYVVLSLSIVAQPSNTIPFLMGPVASGAPAPGLQRPPVQAPSHGSDPGRPPLS